MTVTVYMCACVRVCECARACVRERGRQREREKKKGTGEHVPGRAELLAGHLRWVM